MKRGYRVVADGFFPPATILAKLFSMAWTDYVPKSAWRELEELKKAPVGAVLLLMLGAGVGAWVTSKFYAERFEVMQQRLQQTQESADTKGGRGQLDLADRNVIISYGGAVENQCAAHLNPSILADYADHFNLALICGVSRVNMLSSEDADITISRVFPITSETRLAVQQPHTEALLKVIRDEVERIKATVPEQRHKELSALITVWYQAVLLPKAIKATDIHSVSDAVRLGGQLAESHSIVTSFPFVAPSAPPQ